VPNPFAGLTAAAPAATATETAPRQVTDPAEFWRCQLEAIYQKRNPHKLSGVPALLEKYKGKEAVLYAKVCKTYDLDPSKFYTEPGAWDQYDQDVQEDGAAPAGEASGSASGSGGGAVPVPSLFGITSVFGSSSGAEAPPVAIPAEWKLPSAPPPTPDAPADCKTQ